MFSKLWSKLSGKGFRATGDSPEKRLEQLNSKVASLYQIGCYDEAIEHAMQSVDLTREAVGEQHPDLATSLNNLARLYREMGKYAEAKLVFRQAIGIRRTSLGEAHPDFAQVLNNLALVYDLIGDYVTAEPLYLQASEVVRRAVGAAHPDFAITLNNLAMLYCAMSKYTAAEPLLRQALEIIRVALGEQHPHFATTLNNLATLYQRTGNYASAVQPYEEAMEIRRASLGEQHPDFAASLNNLAQLYGAMGNYAAAEPYLRQSLEIVRAMLGEAHPDFALALSNLAIHHHSMGNYLAAEPLFKQALEIRRTALGEVHPDFAVSLNNLAMLYVSMSDYAAAEPLLRQALEITGKALGTGHPHFATNSSNLAHLYGSTSDYAEAERHSLRATEVRRTALGEQHPDFATSLNNQARLCHQMGNYAAAGPLFRQATEILRVALGEQHPEFAASLNNLAWFYKEIGDYTAAVPLLLQAIEIKRTALGVAHRDVARSLNNLALVYESLGDYAAAEPLFEQALEIWRVALGERHPDFAMSLNNLAMLYLSTGDHAAAEPLFKQAMEIFRSALGERHPDFAASVSNLGLLHQSTGNHTAAELLFEQAVEILRSALGEQHPQFATILVNLASSLAATGRVADARTSMEQALAIHDGIIGQVFAMSSADQRWAYLDSIRIDHDRFLSLVSQHLSHSPEAVRAAFSLVLRRKGIAAEAVATQRDAVLRGRYPDVAPRLRELTALRGQIARKSLAGAGREGRQAHERSLVEWNARRERLEGEVARLVPEMNLERELRAIDHRAVAMAMPAGATLIEFVSFFVCDFKAVSARGEREWQPARYLAFVMPAGEPENVEMIDLGDAELIDRMIAIFHSSIRASQREPDDEVGIRLREAVFAPLMRAIGDRKRLLIAPDVDLARLPFEVLPMGDGRRLIDEYHISYVAAGRDVVRFKVASNRAPARSLVVADPDFNLSTNAVVKEADASAVRRSLNLKDKARPVRRLLGTRLEGESVAAMLDADLWTGGAALDGHLKKCQSPRILHVATHGVFHENAARDPYELRSSVRAMSVSERDRGGGSRVENPLLRSWLLLAGYNTWLKQGELMEDAEDGLLTAEDAAGLDLLDTELVVLSACETGLGDVSVGEGVFGLRRAFVLAGARTLVMSLWKVPDSQTRELMEDFYRRMLGTDGKPPQPRAEALRDAQLAVKARHAHPFYWGAFICQGYDGVLAG